MYINETLHLVYYIALTNATLGTNKCLETMQYIWHSLRNIGVKINNWFRCSESIKPTTKSHDKNFIQNCTTNQLGARSEDIPPPIKNGFYIMLKKIKMLIHKNIATGQHHIEVNGYFLNMDKVYPELPNKNYDLNKDTNSFVRIAIFLHYLNIIDRELTPFFNFKREGIEFYICQYRYASKVIYVSFFFADISDNRPYLHTTISTDILNSMINIVGPDLYAMKSVYRLGKLRNKIDHSIFAGCIKNSTSNDRNTINFQ